MPPILTSRRLSAASSTSMRPTRLPKPARTSVSPVTDPAKGFSRLCSRCSKGLSATFHPRAAASLPEPRSALVRQYRKLFEMEGAELDFTPQARKLVAKMAKERDTGGRGLRSIVEEIMTDIMFELPDMEVKEKYLVTEAIIRGEK